MRYLFDAKLWDRIETVVEFLIMLGLAIAGVIKFNTDIVEAAFYVTLGAIIAPFSGIERRTKRYLLLGGFFLGLFAGYFD
ncbi:hypothetical protein [Dendronalium sp. ChiSLP03b]|uniref:hypothetical protein n=1 Tax=Dendronalium sp. ChiSLP03b TaxID=3075381 RepID=UPI002AD56AA9|nr:hypothetical protein [Dendronalium sp. ChiSLP03b]MDZ8203531.1 hypothetical protein [Dendronalium sp. ChiSLP03b]